MTDFASIPVSPEEDALYVCDYCGGSGKSNPLPVPRTGPGPCIKCNGTGNASPQADLRHPSAADCCAPSSHRPAPHPSRRQPGGAGQSSGGTA